MATTTTVTVAVVNRAGSPRSVALTVSTKRPCSETQVARAVTMAPDMASIEKVLLSLPPMSEKRTWPLAPRSASLAATLNTDTFPEGFSTMVAAYPLGWLKMGELSLSSTTLISSTVTPVRLEGSPRSFAWIVRKWFGDETASSRYVTFTPDSILETGAKVVTVPVVLSMSKRGGSIRPPTIEYTILEPSPQSASTAVVFAMTDPRAIVSRMTAR
mmetsp:Transcript_8386/g.24932  ORF Transcript_8386/g.24932 Transcript_8386/m.24932 type:complete len:215 (+) Transcript_8386:1446-2090(+)